VRITPVVLVVEDETIIRIDIVACLKDEGFTVIEASSADEALEILAAEPAISLIFTDVDMPGSMDGLKLSMAVRDRWPPVKIIVTSGHRHLGENDLPPGSRFHAKPYDHSAITASMNELLVNI
jgi:CheY-like chemotaxis protein